LSTICIDSGIIARSGEALVPEPVLVLVAVPVPVPVPVVVVVVAPVVVEVPEGLEPPDVLVVTGELEDSAGAVEDSDVPSPPQAESKAAVQSNVASGVHRGSRRAMFISPIPNLHWLPGWSCSPLSR
jgi:hypothetical protein